MVIQSQFAWCYFIIYKIKIEGEYFLLNIIHDTMSREELLAQCAEKDKQLNSINILNKSDIMNMYKCESNKALRMLKVMFQMGYGNKIGKEYYISLESHNKFLYDMRGKNIFI